MSERLTNILGYLTLAAILGAIWILFGEDPQRDQGARGERTFAGLAERVNETARIRLSKDGQTVTLEQGDSGWRVAERDNYAADGGKVGALLRGLARSERREPKTANTDRFARIGLGDAATQISLEDDTGGTLLAVQMGTRKENASGRSLTYVFQASDTRAWLVSGLEDAPVAPADWLDIELLTIADDRVEQVLINDVTLARSAETSDYAVSGLAEGETPAASYKRAEPARTIAQLTIEDVQKTANPLLDPVSQVEARTNDGLILTFKLFDQGEETWAQLVAMSTEGSAPEVSNEADAINARAFGWLFKLTSFDARILKQRRADFVTPAAAENNGS